MEGKEVPGPLFDFGLLMFHCGRTLFENRSGPFFYLSKVSYITHIYTQSLTLNAKSNPVQTHKQPTKPEKHTNTNSALLASCVSGGELNGGQTMEQNICVDTTKGL